MYAYSRSRFSRDRTRMVDTLDVIKFICKDLWTIVFRKQIDNLKTNHRVRKRISLSHYRNVDWTCEMIGRLRLNR